jgi:hypothetical protein
LDPFCLSESCPFQFVQFCQVSFLMCDYSIVVTVGVMYYWMKLELHACFRKELLNVFTVMFNTVNHHLSGICLLWQFCRKAVGTH